MKKQIIFLFIALIIFLSLVRAQQDPTNISQALGGQIKGVDKIPKSQEDIDEIRNKYLSVAWENALANNSVVGPIHNFLKKDSTQLIFLVLFAYKYELSFTFFIIFLLWITFFVGLAKFAHSIGWGKGALAFLVGAIASSVLAQLRLYYIFAKFMDDLFLKQQNWWMRTIVIVISFGLILLAYAILSLIDKNLEKNKTEKDKKDLRQQVTEAKALNRGLRGG